MRRHSTKSCFCLGARARRPSCVCAEEEFDCIPNINLIVVKMSYFIRKWNGEDELLLQINAHEWNEYVGINARRVFQHTFLAFRVRLAARQTQLRFLRLLPRCV